jgi:7-carboxy-7-deazaguanine synthase
MDKKFPISEIFTSVQGEGVHTGVAMTFIRLAGCCVGKPYPKERYETREMETFVGLEDMPPEFPIYTEKCTTVHGIEFPCDTDYRVKERLSLPELMERIPKDVERVLITGGEPLIHDITTLITYLWADGKKVHIETSGTVDELIDHRVWVTVSPKFNCYLNMIKRADELKVLVNEKFRTDNLLYMKTIMDDGTMIQNVDLTKLAKTKPVFLQPINFENTVNNDNLKRCLEWQKEYPQLRISIQLHKVLGACIGELVR